VSLSFQQPGSVGAVRPIERFADQANIVRLLPRKVGKRAVVADRRDGLERVVELDMGGGKINGGAAAVEPEVGAQFGKGHRLPVFPGDRVARVVCHGEPGPGRYERRRQYNLLHQHLPPASIHLGTFEGERKQNRAGYDEAGSGMQMLFSALAVSLSVLGGLMIAYGLGAM